MIKGREDEESLQKNLDNLTNWGSTWKQESNLKKCVHIRLTRSHIFPPSYSTLCSQTILYQSQVTYLGLNITEDLSYNQHIKAITSKAMKTLGFLKRNLWDCSSEAKMSAVLSMVRPVLEYLAPVWDPYTAANISQNRNGSKACCSFSEGCQEV